MFLVSILFIFHVFCSTSADVRGISLQNKARRCTDGQIVQNNCMWCICKSGTAYQCKRKSVNCETEDQDFIFLGKPMKATCIPRMTYIYNKTTCICSKVGNWLHKNCDVTFKSLDVKSRPPPLKCEPETYVIVGCNVCRCSSFGFINEKHCTKNECPKKIERRSIDDIRRSCLPGTWYSLAPCQFCHCVNENKLICSTGNTKTNNLLELGSYNLTVCGTELIKEIGNIWPAALQGIDTLRSDVITPSTITPYRNIFTTTPIPVPVPTEETNRKPNEHIDEIKIGNPKVVATNLYVENKLDSKEKNGTVAREPMITLQPYDTEASENEENIENAKEKYIEKSKEGTKEQSGESSSDETNELLSLNKVPINPTLFKTTEFNIPVGAAEKRRIHPMPAQSLDFNIAQQEDGETTQHPDILRIHLPTVLDKLLQMALRKSMVKLEESESKCVPGSTTRNHCNICHCLNNGKILCTDKKCD